jgi:hypothetical protein
MTDPTMTGGYVRHRDRMVQESVFEDLANTLIACRWSIGTTSRPVLDPYDVGAGYQIVTTTADEVLQLLEDNPVQLIDYFPETNDDYNVAGEPDSGKTAPNTLAIDTGRPGEPEPMELGSSLNERPYLFNVAFYAVSDAVAMAVLNDLRDRYAGYLVTDDYVNLYDFNSEATGPVVRMEVAAFRYARDVESVDAHEVHLYFGELTVTDTVE